MTRRFWTDTERATLRALYPDHSAAECAAALGRPYRSIVDQVRRHGLRKSREWIVGRARANTLRQGHGSRSGQFKPGHRTWNSGMKGLQLSDSRTRFKPGIIPHTWRPVGYEIVRADGILYRKVTDDHRGDQARWNFAPVHQLVWRAAHGNIPRGHIVVFKPGMHTTVPEHITLDRLELITRAENMRRNTIHNYAPPVKAVIRLLKRAERALEQRSE